MAPLDPSEPPLRGTSTQPPCIVDICGHSHRKQHPNLIGDTAWSQRELNGVQRRRFRLESDFFNPTPQPCVQQAWSTPCHYSHIMHWYISDKCHVHLRQVPWLLCKLGQSNILATQFTYSHRLAEHKREGSKLRSVAAVQIRDTFSRKTNCHILVRRRMSINEQNESFTCLKAGRSLLK